MGHEARTQICYRRNRATAILYIVLSLESILQNAPCTETFPAIGDSGILIAMSCSAVRTYHLPKNVWFSYTYWESNPGFAVIPPTAQSLFWLSYSGCRNIEKYSHKSPNSLCSRKLSAGILTLMKVQCSYIWKMEARQFSETMAKYYQNTTHHITGDLSSIFETICLL